MREYRIEHEKTEEEPREAAKVFASTGVQLGAVTETQLHWEIVVTGAEGEIVYVDGGHDNCRLYRLAADYKPTPQVGINRWHVVGGGGLYHGTCSDIEFAPSTIGILDAVRDNLIPLQYVSRAYDSALQQMGIAILNPDDPSSFPKTMYSLEKPLGAIRDHPDMIEGFARIRDALEILLAQSSISELKALKGSGDGPTRALAQRVIDKLRMILQIACVCAEEPDLKKLLMTSDERLTKARTRR